MKRIYAFLMLLMAFCVPLALNAQRAALYTEGFESMSSASDLTAAGWIWHASNSSSFLDIETGTTNVHTGSKALNIDSWYANNSDQVVVGLPTVNAPINTLQITFSYKVADGTVYVGYLTDANDATTFVSLQSFSPSDIYTTKTVELADAPATAGRIAIKYFSYFRCYVDDITVEPIPTCYRPQNLQASLTSCDGSIATLTWERHPKGNENAWVLEYGTNSDFSGATPVNVSDNPTADLTGLTPEATYYARVKANCGTNDESVWSATCEFTPTDACSVIVSDGTSTHENAPLYGNYKSSYDQMIYTASQLESVGINGPCSITRIGFNSASANGYPRLPIIYICHAPDDKSSFSSNTDFVSINEFTKVYDFNNHSEWSITEGWNEFELDTPFDYDGSSNLIIAVHCGLISDYKSTYFYCSTTTNDQVIYAYNDNVDPNPFTFEGNWNNYPNAYSTPRSTSNKLPSLKLYYEPVEVSCPRPTGLAIVENTLTGHDVHVEWNKMSSEEEPTVYYQTICVAHGDTPDWTTVDGYSIDRNNNPNKPVGIASGLTPETQYDFYVRRFCGAVDPILGPQPQGEDDFSQATKLVFTTLAACPAPTNFTGVADGTSATLTWQGNSDAYDIAWSVNPNADPDQYLDPDFQISGTTGSMSDMSLDTDYYFWVRANCGSDDGTSTWVGPVTVHIGYCKPEFSSTSDYIDNFTLGNISNQNSGFSTDGYGDFTDLSTVLEIGVVATTSLTSSAGTGAHAAAIWIDFNDDMVFDDSELVGEEDGIGPSTTVEISLILMPGYAAAGSHRLRVVYQYGVSSSNISPCVSADYGEAEDYTVVIVSDSNCPTPINLTATNVTATSATLNWEGEAESYSVRYRAALTLFEDGFEDGLNDWTVFAQGETVQGLDGWFLFDVSMFGGAEGNHNGNASVVSFSNAIEAINADNWLVTPQVNLNGILKFWVYSLYSDEYEVLLSTGGNTPSDFNVVLQAKTAAAATWTEISIPLNGSYAGNQGYIAIHHEMNGGWWLAVDDFGIYTSLEVPQWMPGADGESTSDNSLDITSLDPGTNYEFQVKANCGTDGNSSWSTFGNFTTLEGYVKHILGYNGGTGGYYLIASPIGEVNPTAVKDQSDATRSMVSGTYDLYYFDNDQEKEWINYKTEQGGVNPDFGNLTPGKGYLYANDETIDLVFSGSAQTEITSVTLTVSGNNSSMGNWNLVGNPFAQIAYIQEEHDFYTMDNDGALIVEVNGSMSSIEAMEGVFVKAQEDGEVIHFTTTAPAKNGKGLVINLSRNDRGGVSTGSTTAVIDRAVVRFGEGRTLPKFQIKKNSTKVYIPMEGEDYAVVRSEEVGEMPVSFKAEENGSYTLSISALNAEFGYLHLIDNMTGDDVDLLAAGPSTGSGASYTFTAKTTDYESRFKLVFVCGDANDDNDFAFYSNGSFVINNEGEATLQVIDVMGRILSSETINGSANVNVNAAPGTYMLRLVNGENVKVQKVVVR